MRQNILKQKAITSQKLSPSQFPGFMNGLCINWEKKILVHLDAIWNKSTNLSENTLTSDSKKCFKNFIKHLVSLFSCTITSIFSITLNCSVYESERSAMEKTDYWKRWIICIELVATYYWIPHLPELNANWNNIFDQADTFSCCQYFVTCTS